LGERDVAQFTPIPGHIRRRWRMKFVVMSGNLECAALFYAAYMNGEGPEDDVWVCDRSASFLIQELVALIAEDV